MDDLPEWMRAPWDGETKPHNNEKWTGWETEAEWALEQRAFNWSAELGAEVTRQLINDLWANYCLMYEAWQAETADATIESMGDDR